MLENACFACVVVSIVCTADYIRKLGSTYINAARESAAGRCTLLAYLKGGRKKGWLNYGDEKEGGLLIYPSLTCAQMEHSRFLSLR